MKKFILSIAFLLVFFLGFLIVAPLLHTQEIKIKFQQQKGSSRF